MERTAEIIEAKHWKFYPLCFCLKVSLRNPQIPNFSENGNSSKNFFGNINFFTKWVKIKSTDLGSFSADCSIFSVSQNLPQVLFPVELRVMLAENSNKRVFLFVIHVYNPVIMILRNSSFSAQASEPSLLFLSTDCLPLKYSSCHFFMKISCW